MRKAKLIATVCASELCIEFAEIGRDLFKPGDNAAFGRDER
jgi:hypothetical protein